MREKLLETALEAAHRAGDLLAERLGEERDIEFKGYRDVVTDADHRAERTLLSIIQDRFPHHAILSEEAGKEQTGGPYCWVVDPLDGTTNYTRGHPTFSVSIGVQHRGQTIVGVVHDPMRGHTFAALRDGGAFLNHHPIHVRQTERLDQALVALDWAHKDADRSEVLRRLVALAPRCRTIRALGTAALALSYLAAGWIDLYFGTGLYPWDTVAGCLLVAEAGGRLSGWDGGDWREEQPTLLASNGRLHRPVLQLWRG